MSWFSEFIGPILKSIKTLTWKSSTKTIFFKTHKINHVHMLVHVIEILDISVYLSSEFFEEGHLNTAVVNTSFPLWNPHQHSSLLVTTVIVSYSCPFAESTVLRLAAQSCPTLHDSVDCRPPSSSQFLLSNTNYRAKPANNHVRGFNFFLEFNN